MDGYIVHYISEAASIPKRGFMMNAEEYRDFYDRVGELNGWDFSRVQCHVEGVSADLYAEVLASCRLSDLLLDIGTGGGEAILSIHDKALFIVGIDLSAGMLQTA